MDIITHGITGVLVSRALPNGDRSSLMMAGLIGALAPDLDAIARLWDPMSAITVHRTATHSFIGGAILALAVAGLVWGASRRKFSSLLGIAYLGVLSHLGSDVLNPFGAAIFWPLGDRRFSLAQHYIIDPIFSILALGFLVATFRFGHKSTSLARLGVVTILAYVALASVQRQAALSRWQTFNESRGIKPSRAAVIPLFPGPFRWLGVAETGKGICQQPFWLYGPAPAAPRFFSKTKADPRDLERLREVQAFLNFARFPWKQEMYDGGVRVVEYRDLAFADHPLGGPLSLRIWLDDSNSVQRVEFGHRF